MSQWAVFQGDALELLRTLPSESIDSIVTDPPAGISFMGREWDHHKGGRDQWVAWLTEITRECLRVLKPGGHALFWALPKTSHWTATAVEDGGFELRDVITHHFGSGMPKSHCASKAVDKKLGTTSQRQVFATYTAGGNAGTSTKDKGGTYGVGVANSEPVELSRTTGGSPEARQWDGWGTGLKPSQERWVWAQKPMSTSEQLASLDIWLSTCLANIAGAPSESKIDGPIPPDFAASSVAQLLSQDASFVQTVTSSSSSVRAIAWSIVSSWRDTLADAWRLANTSTTVTEIELTTDLKILRSCLSAITLEDIVAAVSTPNGSTQNVMRAENAFTALRLNCNAIQHRIATAHVGASDNLLSRKESPKSDAEKKMVPGSEDWILARKPLAGTLADNLLRHGAGAINVDGCRVGTDWNEPDRPASWAQSGHSAKPEAEKIAAPPGVGMVLHPGGRWPPNAVFTHSASCRLVGSREVRTGIAHEPETKQMERSVYSGTNTLGRTVGYGNGDGTETVPVYDCALDCPVRVLERQSGVTETHAGKITPQMSAMGFGGGNGSSRPVVADRGTAARFFPVFTTAARGFQYCDEWSGEHDPFFYTAKASTKEREAGCEGVPPAENGRHNDHTTVKAVALMRWLVRLVTPPGGVCLDIFCGSGTTGVACVLEGFHFMGFDAELRFVDISRARIGYWAGRR